MFQKLAVILALLITVGFGGTPATAATPAPLDENAELMLLLDASGSMAEPDAAGGTKIDAARAALTTVVGALEDDQIVGMRVFGATINGADTPGACTDSQLLVPTGSDNRAELAAAIAQYAPYGETPIGHALQQAGADIGDEGPRSILLVSDGIATCDPDPCVVAADLAAQGIDLRIDVVGLAVDDQARNQLQCVADAGNGSYYDADDQASLIAAIDTLATRAFRPFTVSGTPVEGTPAAEGAPALTPDEQYTDVLPAEDEPKTYVVARSIADSAIHVGISALPPVRVFSGVRADLTISTPDGTVCAETTASSDARAVTVMSSGTQTRTSPGDAACAESDKLVVQVANNDSSEAAGTPFELVVIEEPPVQSLEGLPPAELDAAAFGLGVPAEITGSPMAGGTSFNDAPLLEPGDISGEILMGETQFYRIPVGWGQALQTQLFVPPLTGAEAEEYERELSAISIEIYSPTRGQLESPASGSSDVESATLSVNTTIVSTDEPRYASAATAPVRYLNRDASNNADVPALAGEYYISVRLQDLNEGTPFLVPFQLTTAVAGEVAGTPEHVEVAAEGSEEAGGSPTAAGDEPGGFDSLPLVLGVAGAVLLVGGALGLLLLLRRRRSSDS